MAEAEGGHCIFETPLGVCGIAWSSKGLTRVQLPERDRAATLERLARGGSKSESAAAPPPMAVAARDALDGYFSGRRVDFADLVLDLDRVPPFFRVIYDLARALPWGATVTYGELARRAGSPGSSRAVGQAMARNPLPVIIPCHRVLAAGDKAGGFSAYGGLVTKERLLALEGVTRLSSLPLFGGLKPSDDSRS